MPSMKGAKSYWPRVREWLLTPLGVTVAGGLLVGVVLLIFEYVVLVSPEAEVGGVATSAAPSRDTTASPPAEAGRATIRVTPSRPGGCSDSVLVEGEVLAAPAEDRVLWLVARLDADPARSQRSPLYFAKGQIRAQEGPYRFENEANTGSGTRTGAWLIVSADPAAAALLQVNFEKDQIGDSSYDSQRTTLQGADVLDTSDAQEQRCP